MLTETIQKKEPSLILPEERFRLFLQNEYIRRISSNRSYSLRSFAKHLGIHHGTLSQIMRGRRTLTPNNIQKLSAALQIKDPASIISGSDQKKEATGTTPDHVNLTYQQFIAVSTWYHDAILELVKLPSFQENPAWIAKSLGISKKNAEEALERLLELGLLTRLENGDLSHPNTFNSYIGISNQDWAAKKLQKDLREKSIEAIDKVPRTERTHVSYVLPVSKKDLDFVEKEIIQFQRTLAKKLEVKREALDEVYQITVSFFPLSRIKNS